MNGKGSSLLGCIDPGAQLLREVRVVGKEKKGKIRPP